MSTVSRLAVSVQGVVQGVGFRPFVYRLAVEAGLAGWVRNGPAGVSIEVQGEAGALEAFVEGLRSGAPEPAEVHEVTVAQISAQEAEGGFAILASAEDEAIRPTLPADLATCDACLGEIGDPQARRYRYPFTNCTYCGPRYTIVTELPYDRPRTSMGAFEMCAACQAEYENPGDRRFHAQPIACPRCGPGLKLVDRAGTEISAAADAIERAAAALLAGDVVALKGLGGFQLLADATSAEAVQRLRQRKSREEKPFAVMFPDVDSLAAHCVVSPEEVEELRSPRAPILLVRRRREVPEVSLASGVAPGNPRIGAMLPYTPLHRLLLEAVARPLICTSGNLSEEPMCIRDDEALERLALIADSFLLHDRAIVRPVDDSVARLDADGVQLLRRARGFAPLSLPLEAGGKVILAVGGHLKSTVALVRDGEVVVSQHLGDLEHPQGADLHERTIRDLVRFFDVRPEVVACDEHPDYASTRVAERLASQWGARLVRVQHHHAHVAACVAEHGEHEPVLGLAWDGAGFGPDGTVWGGEALVCEGAAYRRVARLRPFPLPGGDQAAREPRRVALALLHAVWGAAGIAPARAWYSESEAGLLLQMLEGRVNTPLTSSVGRLFDAVAALAGVRTRSTFEGQAAMELEWASTDVEVEAGYPLPLRAGAVREGDWEPLWRAVLEDRQRSVPLGVISARFHDALVAFGEEIAVRAGIARVALCGGCFQNLRLATDLTRRLRERGFQVLLPRRFPPNDGAISLGQALVAALSANGTT